MSKTCDVYVKLPYGVIIGEDTCGIGKMAMDSQRLLLEHGFNEGVDRARVERWLTQNKNLAAVKRGDVRIVDQDRHAVDSRK